MAIHNKLILDELRKIKIKFDEQIKQKKHQFHYTPGDELIAIHSEFKELLDNNKGKQRSTKEFEKQVNDLSARQAKAKEALNKYNPETETKQLLKIAKLETAVYELHQIINPIR